MVYIDRGVKTFIIKHAVIASAFSFIIGFQIRELSIVLVDSLVEPLFSLDLNNDGKPDLKQLSNYVAKVFGISFPLGKIFLELVKTVVTILLIYVVIKYFMKYTPFLKK